jgi:hypothetical protein
MWLGAQKKSEQCSGLPLIKSFPDDGLYAAETCCKLEKRMQI